MMNYISSLKRVSVNQIATFKYPDQESSFKDDAHRLKRKQVNTYEPISIRATKPHDRAAR